MKIKILPSALADLDRGRIFYARQSKGIGDYFLDSLFSDIDSLELYAGVHIKVFDFHRLLSKRFPFRGRCRHDLGVVVLLVGHPNDACRYTLVRSLKNWNRLECLKDLSTKRFTGVQNISANILEKERSRPRPLQALVPDWSYEIEPTSGAFVSTHAAIEKRITRAKKVLASSKRLFDVTAASEFSERLPSVHRVLYLLFNEGYHGASAETVVAKSAIASVTELVITWSVVRLSLDVDVDSAVDHQR